jgi:hypothetical protein
VVTAAGARLGLGGKVPRFAKVSVGEFSHACAVQKPSARDPVPNVSSRSAAADLVTHCQACKAA